jgi:hypothetical protein
VLYAGSACCIDETELLSLNPLGRVCDQECAGGSIERAPETGWIVEIRCHEFDAGRYLMGAFARPPGHGADRSARTRKQSDDLSPIVSAGARDQDHGGLLYFRVDSFRKDRRMAEDRTRTCDLRTADNAATSNGLPVTRQFQPIV